MAVAIDGRGVRLWREACALATACRFEELRWSCSLGETRAFGIEGTGSYGAGVARFMTESGIHGHRGSTDRIDRSDISKGKSDPTDVRDGSSFGAGRSSPMPLREVTWRAEKSRWLRMLKSARDSAIKARTQAGNLDEGPGCHSPGRASRVCFRWPSYHQLHSP